MLLSKDPVKRAIREEYWRFIAKYWRKNKGEQIVMLPGAHCYDAQTAQATLRISRSDMICVDYSSGVLARFSKEFPGTQTVKGDIFEVLEVLRECSPPEAFGVIDLDLCGCATPRVVQGIKRLCTAKMLAKGCVIGITVCRRWKTEEEQKKILINAFKPAKWIGYRAYSNMLKHSHMMMMTFQTR